MIFRPLSPRSVRWRPVGGEGLEHLTIRPVEGGHVARSALGGTFQGHAFGAFYEIVCDATFRTISLSIETTDGRSLALRSPEPGCWIDQTDAACPLFDGCIDVDLSATPFTNTLPIRRLGLAEADGEIALRMLYVPFDTLAPFPDEQFYAALDTGRRYRFTNDDRSFVADLDLDEDGLVLDYPGLFKRL